MPEDADTDVDLAGDISDHLPLGLVRSHLIPPAPNRRKSAIDWLYDFSGFSWIAYGASSLLVISHFPSPLSPHEAEVGPLFQQVIEPPPCDDGDGSDELNAVSWCPAEPSEGVVAAALGNRVWMYSPESARDLGSFYWRQNKCMVQSFKVEAISWTGCGDGLIVIGTDVVLWRRKNIFWEVAWKSRADVPQSLVATTAFAEGPIATAACLSACPSEKDEKEHSPFFGEACKNVLVYLSDEICGISKVQLCHPQPVSMIQWRPSAATHFMRDDSHSWRDVLLTSCLDGTVRLWSEIDNGRARKFGKDAHDQRSARRLFHVIAVIEINQCLKGTLGKDIFIEWAIEFSSLVSKGDGDSYFVSSDGSEHDHIGKCEWLISSGPGSSSAFWAIHCLDDISPQRLPRVTLWKKQDLMDLGEFKICKIDLSKSTDTPVLVKVAAWRSHPFGPPVSCSLLQLSPENTISWYQMYSPTVNGVEKRDVNCTNKEKMLSCFARGTLNLGGHSGKIIQLAIHPFSCEGQLAVALDTNGLLLFWLISTLPSGPMSMPIPLRALWKFLGAVSVQALSSDAEYFSLRWAPSVSEENTFLLLEYADGIDCFQIQISGKGEGVLCQKIFTILFTSHDRGDGPADHIFTIPLPSTCGQFVASNSFLVVAVWVENFRALSWKVILHSTVPSGSNNRCNSDTENVSISESGPNSFANKMYYATVDMCTSKFPDTLNYNQVTSVAAVLCEDSMLSFQHCMNNYNDLNGTSFGYQIATGYSDGSLKLWKISHPANEQIFLHWELVGTSIAHKGPVSAISLSGSNKIATISTDGETNASSLHIWESVFLIGSGKFLLEDVISLTEPIVALNWLSIGNGQSLLGVCMSNQLHIYSEKRSNLEKSEKPEVMQVWSCIARSHTYSVSHDFFWGPKVMPVLVHEKYISIFSQWLFRSQQPIGDHFVLNPGEIVEGSKCSTYFENDACDTKEPLKKSKNNGHNICTLCLEMSRSLYDASTRNRLHSMVDIADRLCGSLPSYHPKALLQHLYSGNWKRAVIVLKHLIGHVKSNVASVVIQEKNKSGAYHRRIPETSLSRYFEDTVLPNLSNGKFQWGQSISGTSSLQFERNMFHFMDDNDQKTFVNTSQESDIMDLRGTIEKCSDIIAVTDGERIQILAIIDLLDEICDSSHASPYQNLDESGRRFWVSVRFQQLSFNRKFGRLAAVEEFGVNFRMVAWAFQSDCQDNLLGSILSTESSWLEMRNLGLGYWLNNATQLRTRMEKLARLQYLRNKDPKDCALLYLALNRLHVLAGLFKVSRNAKDKLLVGFLSRNFQMSSSSSHSDSIDDEYDGLVLDPCILGATFLGNYVINNCSKEPKHTSSYKGWMWIRDVLEGHEALCHEMFRMEKKVFRLLCNTLKTQYDLRPSRNMDVEEMVGLFLYTLAHGSINRNTLSRFSRSGETISRKFKEVLVAVLRLAMDIIRPVDPQYTDVHPKILGDPRYYLFFKDCIGALDGTHVKCVVPSSSQAQYIGRKGYATQNILAICDFDMCFTFVWAGWEGTAHDSRIFNEARTTRGLNFPHPPPGKYYLVDSGYPMPVGYIAPYKRERYHIPEFRRDRTFHNSNELFNYYHSSLRCTIERTFGVWKNRFRLLQNMPSYSFAMQRNIVVASMAIHNFIRRHTRTISDFLEYELNEDFNPEGSTAADPTMEGEDEILLNQTCGQMVAQRDSIRDELVNYHSGNA